MKNVMNVMEWIAKIAYLNVLWLLFTAAGLVVFGLFPATVAMFTIIRKWLMGTIQEWDFRMFWDIYKQEFWKSNRIGAVFFVVFFLSYVNIQYMNYYETGFHQMIKVPLMVVMIVLAVAMLYVIPVYVHYQVSLKEVFKYSFYLMLIHPIYNIGMLISLGISLLMMLFLPNAVFFFLGSLTAYIIMRTCLHVFTKVSEKQEMLRLNEN
ncbi:YesL family protein [Gracilibacillus alcaliphilus]|uniref:YesL family protein n=1 Tax=Gracilibacillus alcaliphilus TaxID=1401441 RepID=UPI00195D095F|nr:YesL family protein [Gracilibacillus alcaliphilus]MBM7679130.1 putative membrane protein YesL [Gracilibacillus alcaliphilus]